MSLKNSFLNEIPDSLIQALRKADRVTVLTGAGISAESGVPTFRDAQSGLWAKYDPLELATPQAFRQNPGLVWDWYLWRRELISQAKPNLGHLALAQLEKMMPQLELITQNVDGLHQLAGSKNVLELHGNIMRNKCFEENRIVDNWIAVDSGPPQCPRCGGLLRPDVVWFGEPLDHMVLDQALRATESCQLFFAVGTSGVVHPAASLPVEAKQYGATIVEINLNQTPLTVYADYFLQGPSGRILPAFIKFTFHK